MVSKLTLLFLLFLCFNKAITELPKPLFQSEAKYEVIDMKMNYYSPANNTHFHKKGFESGSLWNSERAYSRENKNSPTCNLDFNVRCGAHEPL